SCGRDGCSGTSGFPANIQDVSAFFDQSKPVFDGTFRIEIAAAIGERIRSDVYHAHNQGSRAQDERAFAQIPDEIAPLHVRAILNQGRAANVRVGRPSAFASALFTIVRDATIQQSSHAAQASPISTRTYPSGHGTNSCRGPKSDAGQPH